MLLKKTFFLIIIISCCSAVSFAQSILYSQLFDQKYSKFYYAIAGKVGNNYHIWKTPQSGNWKKKEKIAIDIIILSDQMKMIGEKKLMLYEPDARAMRIKFASSGAFYYVRIDFYNSGVFIRQQILKIDENGSIIDSTILPNEFLQKALAVDYTSSDSTTLGYANWVYAVTTRQINHNDGSEQIQSLFDINRNIYETEMIVRKKPPPDTTAPTQIKYNSSKFDFVLPKIALDSHGTIWVCASKRPQESKDSSNNLSFFIVKLDSNLNELSGGAKFIKSNFFYSNAQVLFTPQKILITNKQLFLISIGTAVNTFNYSDENGDRKKSFAGYQLNLIRITQIDESMNLLRDTLISLNPLSQGSMIHTYSAFYSIQDSTVDMLCAQQFPHNMSGIKHIKFSKTILKKMISRSIQKMNI